MTKNVLINSTFQTTFPFDIKKVIHVPFKITIDVTKQKIRYLRVYSRITNLGHFAAVSMAVAFEGSILGEKILAFGSTEPWILEKPVPLGLVKPNAEMALSFGLNQGGDLNNDTWTIYADIYYEVEDLQTGQVVEPTVPVVILPTEQHDEAIIPNPFADLQKWLGDHKNEILLYGGIAVGAVVGIPILISAIKSR